MGWTHNLSRGGACVELAERLQPGMSFQVLLQAAQGYIRMEAQVVWARESIPPGGSVFHGIAFAQIAADQDQALRDLLHTSETHVRHAGVRLTSDIPVSCQRKGQAEPPIQGWTEDVSRAGLMLHLPQAFPPGTTLELTLHIAGERVAAEGSVVWVEPPETRKPGEAIRHGVRFTALGLFLAVLP
jgi:c-di-GMP-binding flagellar brake protein YcgR